MNHLQLVRIKLSKVLAITIFSGILSANAITSEAATLKDINSCAPYAKEAVSALAAGNVIKGGSNGYFNPTETVTRGHMITMLVRALGYDTSNIPSTPTFNDVPASHWAYKYVEAAYREGIITKGAKGNFEINEECTRQQMAAMFVRSLGLKDEQINNQQELVNVNALKDKNSIADWAKDHVEFAMSSGLMIGFNDNFSASSPASRQQAAVVIYRYLNNRANTIELAKAFTTPVQYPELYETLKSGLLGYKGDLASNVVLKMHNKPLNEDVDFNFDIRGTVNGTNSQLKLKMDFSGTGLPSSSMEYDTMSIGNQLFMKLPGETKWYLVPAEQSSQGSLAMDNDSYITKFEQFMRSYRKLTIINAGQIDLNGVATTKYEITLNNEAFKSLFTMLTANGYFDQPVDMEQVLKNPFEGKVEIYLDGENRIVRDRFEFKANMKFEDTGDDIDINSSIDTNYTNIGVETEITAPPLNEVIDTSPSDSSF